MHVLEWGGPAPLPWDDEGIQERDDVRAMLQQATEEGLTVPRHGVVGDLDGNRHPVIFVVIEEVTPIDFSKAALM